MLFRSKNGRVYIIFTIDEAKMALNCAEQKAIKLLSELEKKAGLIERKRGEPYDGIADVQGAVYNEELFI